MVNISSETPHKKQINTDMAKAAVAGDWISGRNPYKEPTKQQYKNQSNSVFAFISHYLEKTDEDCRALLKKTYELYISFCNSEGEKDVLIKPEFQSILRSSGYRIENSSKHSNAVCIFGVKIRNV